MRILTLLSSATLATLILFTSCSKQDISLPNEAILAEILIGEWNVESAKYRVETGSSFITHNSDVAVGKFEFTLDSAFHNVSFTYSFDDPDDTIPPLVIPVLETRYGAYELSDLDNIVVNEQVSNLIVTYRTFQRTASSMTLYYEFSSTLPTTPPINQKERYTFELTKL